MRRSKIVCTLGPAVDSYEQLVALIEAGMNVARFNFSHGTHAEHQGGTTASARPPRRPAAPSASSPTSRARRSAWRPSPRAPSSWCAVTSSSSPPRTSPATRPICGTTYKGLPGDVTKGDQILINDGNVELKVLEVEGPRVQDDRHRGRCHLRPQGHQPARRGRERPGAVREGRRGPALRAAHGLRHGRAVLRPRRRGRRRRPQGDGRGGPPGPRHRQGGEAAGGRQHGGRRRWRSTPSWWPVATWPSSTRSRRSRWCRSASSSCAAATPSR